MEINFHFVRAKLKLVNTPPPAEVSILIPRGLPRGEFIFRPLVGEKRYLN